MDRLLQWMHQSQEKLQGDSDEDENTHTKRNNL